MSQWIIALYAFIGYLAAIAVSEGIKAAWDAWLLRRARGAVKRIDIKEFRDKGFLQEVNRRVLHPCGLALEVVIGNKGRYKLGGVWDYRDDPEGMLFADLSNPSSWDKVSKVNEERLRHEQHRRNKYGWVIQPPGSKLPREANSDRS